MSQIEQHLDNGEQLSLIEGLLQHHGLLEGLRQGLPAISGGEGKGQMLEDACAETAVPPVNLGIPPIPVADKPDF